MTEKVPLNALCIIFRNLPERITDYVNSYSFWKMKVVKNKLINFLARVLFNST